MTFTEVLEEIDCAAVGKLVSYESHAQTDGYTEYTFEVTDVWRGEAEDTIHVFSAAEMVSVEGTENSYETGNNIYSVGEEYVLIMSKLDSLFYEYPHYGFYADVYIPVNDTSKSTIQGRPLEEVSGLNISAIKTLIQNTNAKMSDSTQNEQNYTTATDLPTILQETDLVLEVKVTELFVESEYANSNTYYCDVLNVLKGGSVTKSEERGDIMITLMKGSVEIGETYVVLVNQVGEDSLIYTQSSTNSVIPSNDTETINEIQSLIAEG